MRNKLVLFSILALCGFSIGPGLEALHAKAPRRTVSMGQNLVGAKLSPQGDSLVAVGRKSSGQWFCQAFNGRGKELKSIDTMPSPPGRFHAMAWHPHRGEIALAAVDQVWLFDPLKGSVKKLKANAQVRHLEYRGNLLLARTDNSVFLWNAESYKLQWRLDLAYLLHARLDPNGEILATSSFEDGVRLFQVKKKKFLAHLEPGALSCGLGFSKSGQWLTCGFRERSDRSKDRVTTYCLKTKKIVGPALAAHSLYGFDVSDNGELIVARERSGAKVFRTVEGEQLSHRQGDSPLVDSMSPDGRWVASTPSLRGQVAVWSSRAASEEELLEIGHGASDVHFANSRTLLVVNGQASLWKIPD